jgi:hypothetical protein
LALKSCYLDGKKMTLVDTSILYDMNDNIHPTLVVDLLKQNRFLFSSSSISNVADFAIPNAYTPFFLNLINLKENKDAS